MGTILRSASFVGQAVPILGLPAGRSRRTSGSPLSRRARSAAVVRDLPRHALSTHALSTVKAGTVPTSVQSPFLLMPPDRSANAQSAPSAIKDHMPHATCHPPRRRIGVFWGDRTCFGLLAVGRTCGFASLIRLRLRLRRDMSPPHQSQGKEITCGGDAKRQVRPERATKVSWVRGPVR